MPASRVGCVAGRHYGQYGGVYGAVYGGAVFTSGACSGPQVGQVTQLGHVMPGHPLIQGHPTAQLMTRPTLLAIGPPPNRSPAPMLTSKSGAPHGPRMY